MARSTKHDSFTSPTQAVDGLNRSLLGFSDSLEARVGVSIPSNVDGAVSALSEINSSLQQVLGPGNIEETRITYTDSLPLKIGIPQSIKDTVSGISSTLEDLVSALETAKLFLESLRSLIISLEDALKLLLQEILNRIERVLNIFKLDAKARLLLVPPIVPQASSNGSEPSFIDASIVEGFLNVVDKAYPPGTEQEVLPGRLDRSTLRNQLIAFSTQSRSASGSAAFLDTITKSFEDEEDFNRPTETLGWTAGILVQAGFPSTGDLLDTWAKIQKVFSAGYNKFTSIDPTISPSNVEISRVKVTGYSEDRRTAELFVTLNNPSAGGKSTGLYPSTIKYAPLLTELYVLRSIEGVADPNVRAALFADYDTYSDNNFEGLEAVFSDSFSVISNVNISSLASTPKTAELDSDSLGAPLEAGFTYELRLKSIFHPYELQDDGSYERYNGNEYQSFTRYASPVSIRIPIDSDTSAKPLISSGAQPNWIKYGKNWTIPALDDLKIYFNKLIEQLRSLLSVASNTIQQIIDLYLLLIEKLRGMLQTLLNISYLIEKLLNLELGADIIIFTCNNGAAGLKKALVDYLNEQKAGYESALASGTSTTPYKWFANGESVCGAVLTASSETAEIIEKFLSVMSILFSLEKESSAVPALAVDSTLSSTPDIASGPINAGIKTPLFSDALGGLVAADHLQSQENLCG